FTLPPTPSTSPLPLHDALPICGEEAFRRASQIGIRQPMPVHRLRNGPEHHMRRSQSGESHHRPPEGRPSPPASPPRRKEATNSRSEEHTSELQSLTNLVCRLLL